MLRLRFLLASAIMGLVFLTACGTTVSTTPTPKFESASTASPTLLPASTPVPAAPTAIPLPSKVTSNQQITIEATDRLTFVPDSITVTLGQTVELTLVNKGTLNHTFSIPDLNIEVQMPVGEKNNLTFIPPKTGEYLFILMSLPSLTR